MGTKNAAFRNGQADYSGGVFDGGEIRLLDGASNVLATVSLQTPAFGAASSGQISAAGTPLSFTGTAAAGSGTNIASATLISGDGTQEISGLSVGTANANVVLDNVNIAEDQNGNLNTFTYTIPDSVVDPSA